VIGTDVPGIRRAHVARAFEILRGCHAVFGPAEDGGYWLVGWGHGNPPAGFLRGVRWSGAHALADSIASAPAARIGLADRLRDVDDAADLAAVAGFSQWRGSARHARAQT
jgi:glycosyltransferase A (GT-A) superfamily protein (DUF2064 family)